MYQDSVSDVTGCDYRLALFVLQDTFGKSDPFIRISRGMVPVFKTEVVMNNLNPTFRPFTVCLQRLAGGDPYRPLSLDVFDWNSSGTHAQIGSVAASADDMVKRCVCVAHDTFFIDMRTIVLIIILICRRVVAFDALSLLWSTPGAVMFTLSLLCVEHTTQINYRRYPL